MKSIFTVFLDIEKLIYKVLMWFILVPKTIVQITLNPAWAPGYVKGELENDEAHFDEYISPIILLLIVALIPALAFNLLPTFGATISSPAETQPTTDRILSFDVRTDFRSSSTEMEYFHIWSVTRIGEQTVPVQTEGETAQGETQFEPVRHFPGADEIRIEVLDENSVKDTLIFTFPDPGEYVVSVIAGKYDPDRFDPVSGAGVPNETYSASLRVIVPSRTDAPIVISNEQTAKATEAMRTTGIETITAQVQKENTIFLALALMLPPLLFALATKLFITKDIGEDTLKENFYTQCYYFSPPSLTIWASYYARYFFTSDAYLYADSGIAVQIIWLPPLLAALWFVRAEVKTIEDARGTSGLRAVTITLVCIAVLLFAAYIIFRFATLQDDVRLFAIRAFPVLATALIIGFGIAWYRRRRARNESMYRSHFFWIGVNAVVLIALMNFVSARFGIQTQSEVVSRPVSAASPTALVQATELPASTEAAATPTAQITVAENSPTPEGTMVTEAAESPTPSPTPTPNPFFVEEFNTDLATWTMFMTSGDSRMVEWKVERSVLAIQLFQVEEKTPQFYLVNDAFSYSDVKVEAVVSNRGNNSNGVGLICRYSDIGWYEVQISNSQTFSFWVVDNIGIVSQGYNEVARFDSNRILSGLTTNVYTVTCKGNVISLSVNGELLYEYTDEKFGFTDGKIGLSVWSLQALPVNVEIETLTISAPE